jgi:hypothetical protein
MSLWKSLFGGGKSSSTASGPAKAHATIEHKGYRIEAQPYLDSGQYQVAGAVSREVDGAMREHTFIRADRFATIEEASDVALMKGRQLVDQQGDRIFS